ncbi:XdhC family protein [Kineococcus gypseus]|uniref:XdhC family protein n=1 Tax=Kineococcus gypseus TaxID=1637102 RepID=UPI003D7E7D8E
MGTGVGAGEEAGAVLARVEQWLAAGGAVALATVVRPARVEPSPHPQRPEHLEPRPAGTVLALGPRGEVAGALPCRCAQPAALELARRVLAGAAPVLRRCSGACARRPPCAVGPEVFVERVDRSNANLVRSAAASVRAGEAVAVATVVAAPDPAALGRHLLLWPARRAGSLGPAELDDAVARAARELLRAGTSGAVRVSGAVEVFVAAHPHRALPRAVPAATTATTTTAGTAATTTAGTAATTAAAPV